MSEWWTYRLHSFLMFSRGTWERLVENYNAQLWPAQWIAFGAAVAVLGLAVRGTRPSAMWMLLAAGWAWTAWAFLWMRYAPIFLGGPWMAGAFAVQAVLLLAVPHAAGRALSMLTAGLLVVALVAYGIATKQLPGLMPDPTAAMTLVIVLGTLRGWRRVVLSIVPALATVVGMLTWWALLE